MAEKPEWKLISNNEPLNPGDRIRLYYTIIGPLYMLAAQMAAIEKKLDADPRLSLIATSLPSGDGWVKDIWFEIHVVKPPKSQPQIQQAGLHVGIVTALVAGAFAILGVFCWLSLKEVRRMEIVPEVKEVIKETGWTAMKIAAAAVVAAIGLKMWKG